jgi:hypothetical protein
MLKQRLEHDAVPSNRIMVMVSALMGGSGHLPADNPAESLENDPKRNRGHSLKIEHSLGRMVDKFTLHNQGHRASAM